MFFYSEYGKMFLECKYMSLFKKKRKVEEINISLEETDNAIEEKVEVKAKALLPSLPEEAIAIVNKKYSSLLKVYNNLLYNFYLCKFFSLAVYKNIDEFSQFASLEHQINNTKELFESVKTRITKLNEDKDYVDSYINDLYDDINHVNENCLGLVSRIDEERRNKFNLLKISSLAVILNKSGEELEKMDKRFTLFVNSFKSIEEASDFIFVNSGELVTNLVNSLVRCVASTNRDDFKNKYNLYYFLKSDVIIWLSLADWVEIYNKVRHATTVLRNVDIANYIDFSGYLEEFEIRYLVLMINEEKKNLIKGGKDEKIN